MAIDIAQTIIDVYHETYWGKEHMTNKVRCARCRKWGITTVHKKLAWGMCQECRTERKPKLKKLVWR